MSDSDQDAVAAQLAEMRQRLLRDAAASGTAEVTVNAAVNEIAAGYAGARVTSFITSWSNARSGPGSSFAHTRTTTSSEHLVDVIASKDQIPARLPDCGAVGGD